MLERPTSVVRERKPPWLKVRFPGGENYIRLKNIMREGRLHTVCEEAHCPNIGECWEAGTATFMILGDTCTRACGFCAVKSGRPGALDKLEPMRVAKELDAETVTKSGLMVGLGETKHELLMVFGDLVDAGVDVLTLGQYLQPSAKHLPLVRYYHPDEFAGLREDALALGFRHVEAGPLVRSSYHAERQVKGVRGLGIRTDVMPVVTPTDSLHGGQASAGES